MIDNLRIQDIVARTAGVSLRSSVKTLRALSTISRLLGEKSLANELDSLLLKSAQVNGHISRLHDQPGRLNSIACEFANRIYQAEYSQKQRDESFKLLGCPYEENRIRSYLESRH